MGDERTAAHHRAALSVVETDDVRTPGDQTPVLPERVRRYVVDLAADVLGALPEQDAPAALRRVRTFAPARRSRAGAAPLAVALERDAVFRQLVAASWRETHPELAAAIDDGELPPAADPVVAAAGTYLCRPPDWPRLLGQWLQALVDAELGARRLEDAASVTAELEAAVREADHWRSEAAAAEAARAELTEEVVRLRREHRRLRADADRARAAAREAEQRAAEDQEKLTSAAAERESADRQAERRVRELEEQLTAARRLAREGRSIAETRARLLLDTIIDAASGLRRELALPPVGQLPADLVAPEDSASGTLPARALADDDPAVLDELLRLPRAHLIVDGYNVTKTGYGTLALVDQRHRLVDGLAGLAARTAAEVTCCFDGAEVEARGAGKVRGVRVLFSEPGMTADELIRRLVRAEPGGRVVVVVSSDGEVISGVVAAGARAVPATALLRLLSR